MVTITDIIDWCIQQALDHNELYIFNGIENEYFHLDHKSYYTNNYGPFKTNSLLNYNNVESKLNIPSDKTFDIVYKAGTQ